MRLLTVVSLVTALAAHAGDDLSPEDLAALQHAQTQAAAEVAKKYEGRKLTGAEMRAQAKEQAAAERAVLDAKGVDPKEFARASTKMSREDRAMLDAALKREKAKAGEKKAAAPTEIVVEKGGLPPADDGAAEAAEMDKAMGLGQAPASTSKKTRRR